MLHSPGRRCVHHSPGRWCAAFCMAVNVKEGRVILAHGSEGLCRQTMTCCPYVLGHCSLPGQQETECETGRSQGRSTGLQ